MPFAVLKDVPPQLARGVRAFGQQAARIQHTTERKAKAYSGNKVKHVVPGPQIIS